MPYKNVEDWRVNRRLNYRVKQLAFFDELRVRPLDLGDVWSDLICDVCRKQTKRSSAHIYRHYKHCRYYVRSMRILGYPKTYWSRRKRINVTKGHYLCGCDPKDPRFKNYYAEINPVTGALSFNRYDSQGYKVCPEHGARLYGYSSLTTQGPQGNDVTDYAEMWARTRFTEKNEGELGTATIPDRRDNRDPNKIGKTFLARSNGKNNKKAKANGVLPG